MSSLDRLVAKVLSEKPMSLRTLRDAVPAHALSAVGVATPCEKPGALRFLSRPMWVSESTRWLDEQLGPVNRK